MHGLALDAEQRRLVQYNRRGFAVLRVLSSKQFARTVNRGMSVTPRVGYPGKLPLEQEDFARTQIWMNERVAAIGTVARYTVLERNWVCRPESLRVINLGAGRANQFSDLDAIFQQS